ncbi:MAG TPA: FAD/NAD(P)-binding oxidoreductase [Herpetosiphonaceae bacterium]|nr:FAD/NAD(P)-binding oxidoreductase [Herpetosiphonaceae bacterium]
MRCFDVLVVGAGPGGLAAAALAAESGGSVGLIDENPAVGGQIWRGGSPESAAWSERARAGGVTVISRARVVAAADHRLLLETPDRAEHIGYRRLILATGARERFLPFPGWTLPNVVGAGGLQALVKGGLPIAGKRVVVAGSGPLLLAVAGSLRRLGAQVVLIAEQTSWRRLAGFGAGLARDPAKLAQALGMSARLRGIPLRAGCWVIAAHGNGALRSVTLRSGGRAWDQECDYLACGFGLLPNLELPRLLGCRIERGFVWVDSAQHTSAADVYAAGELTGIGGLDKALVEGRIAGLHATNRGLAALEHGPRRRAALAFARRLEHAFALRPELLRLAEEATIVCRCEDVRYGELRRHASWRSAKLQTRCGMGACQGRICGGATELLFGWTQDSVRPPIVPARLGTLIGDSGFRIQDSGFEGRDLVAETPGRSDLE